MARKMNISLKCTAGAINMFWAWVDDKKVISDDGTQERKWEGDVGEKVHITVRVAGIGQAKYQFSINLPDTINNQKMEFSLKGGYHDFKLETT